MPEGMLGIFLATREGVQTLRRRDPKAAGSQGLIAVGGNPKTGGRADFSPAGPAGRAKRGG